MKKNIEWLKNRLTNTLKFEAQNDREIGFKVATEEVIELLNQLDKPEVLSQEWIDEHAFGDWNEYVYTEDLQEVIVPKQEITFEQAYDKLREESILSEKSFDYYWNCISDNVEIDEPGNLLVPKQEITEEQAWYFIAKKYNQEGSYWFDARNHYLKTIEKPVIPQFVADFIKVRKGTDTYSLKYILCVAVERGEQEQYTKAYDWISTNEETFARAWLDGFKVEEEQKYYVRLGEKMYFAGWYEADATFVFDDSPNSLERAKTYNLKDGKEKIKELGTGELVKAEELEE